MNVNFIFTFFNCNLIKIKFILKHSLNSGIYVYICILNDSACDNISVIY